MRDHAAVFAAGLAVMGLELLAGRWLAPAFGATLTTWTWVIAVTLAAGALGSWLGGASRAGGVVWPLLWGGLLACGDALRAPRLVEGLVPLPQPWGAGVAASVLLLLPVLACSMVLPRVLGRRPGARAGSLLAAGTAGALAGTLAAGLLGIPLLGLRVTAFAVTGVLALAAAAAARRGSDRVAAAALLAVAVLGTALLRDGSPPGEIAARESLAGRVSVVREAGGVALRVDGILQGTLGIDARDGAALARRGQHAGILPYLRPTAREALVVGLGSGLLGQALGNHGIAVEAVEVNPDLADLAREHLGVQGNVRVGDGRAVWRTLPGRYDLVVLDAFQGEGLPPHLLTREAFQEVARLLAPGGVLAVHLIGGPTHRVTSAVARTLASVFRERLALRSDGEEPLQDLMLLASDAPLVLPPHPDLLEAGLARAVFAPPGDGLLLTDDRNPLDLWNEAQARALRARQGAGGRP